MCLSTAYRNTKTPEAIFMKNVMEIQIKDGVILLTDLLGNEMAVEGTLQEANLVEGFVLIQEEAQNVWLHIGEVVLQHMMDYEKLWSDIP